GRNEHREASGVSSIYPQASKANRALVLLYDAAADPKPKSRTLCRLCAEKRFEDLLGVLAPNPCPRVIDGNSHAFASAVALLRLEQVDAQPAAVGHGLDRISNQVQKYLLQFDRKTMNHSGTPVALIQHNVVQLQSPRLQFHNIIEKFAQRDWHRSFRFPVEAKCLLGNVCTPLQFLLCKFRVVLRLFVQGGMFPEQVESIRNRFQRIVDFVG